MNKLPKFYWPESLKGLFAIENYKSKGQQTRVTPANTTKNALNTGLLRSSNTEAAPFTKDDTNVKKPKNKQASTKVLFEAPSLRLSSAKINQIPANNIQPQPKNLVTVNIASISHYAPVSQS